MITGVEKQARWLMRYMVYRKISDIRRTNSQNLNVSRLILQLLLRYLLKPCVMPRMKM